MSESENRLRYGPNHPVFKMSHDEQFQHMFIKPTYRGVRLIHIKIDTLNRWVLDIVRRSNGLGLIGCRDVSPELEDEIYDEAVRRQEILNQYMESVGYGIYQND